MLTISHLTKTITTDWMSKKTLLHDISLDIESGSIVALLGPNGAGKTTLIKCIMGFMKTQPGHITTSCDHIGYAPDTTQLFPRLTGYEQMKLIADLHQEKKNSNHLSSLMEQVGLNPSNKTPVSSYSAGMKKRLGLAMSLTGNPDFLIRDEPMAGVDPLGRITIRKLIHDLKAQNKTLLFSTHILSDVEEVADNVAIINQGKLLHQGSLIDIDTSLEQFFTQTVKK